MHVEDLTCMVAQSFLALSLPPVMLFTSFANTGLQLLDAFTVL